MQERKGESPELPLKLNTSQASVIDLFIIIIIIIPSSLPLDSSQTLSILTLIKKWD